MSSDVVGFVAVMLLLVAVTLGVLWCSVRMTPCQQLEAWCTDAGGRGIVRARCLGVDLDLALRRQPGICEPLLRTLQNLEAGR